MVSEPGETAGSGTRPSRGTEDPTWVSDAADGLPALVRALKDGDLDTVRGTPPASLGTEDSTVRAPRLPMPPEPAGAGAKDSTIRLPGSAEDPPKVSLGPAKDSTIRLPPPDEDAKTRRSGSFRFAPNEPLDLHRDEPTASPASDDDSPSSLRLAPDEPLDLHSDFTSHNEANRTVVADSQPTIKDLLDNTDDDVSDTVVNLPENLRAIVEAKTVVLNDEYPPDACTVVVPDGMLDRDEPTLIGDFSVPPDDIADRPTDAVPVLDPDDL